MVNKDLCTNCGLCEKVCPFINNNECHKPQKIYAAKNQNEKVRIQSSSGGFFTILAETTIKNGGIVFGAKFDGNWNVIHSWTDTIEGIAAFQGSKYVQSTIGSTYTEVKEFLNKGRKVLFSGTPCQILGLKKYLRKEFTNLLCVSIACHGVPSPIVWQEFLSSKKIKKADISSISFRNKKDGWRNYRLHIESKSGKSLLSCNKYDCSYIHGFIRSFYLRPSCYSCKVKEGRCGCDFLLADFWGVENVMPQYDDNKGISLVVVYTPKATEIARTLGLSYTITEEEAFRNNPCIIYPTPFTEKSDQFWNLWEQKGYLANEILLRQYKKTLFKRIVTKIKSIFQ